MWKTLGAGGVRQTPFIKHEPGRLGEMISRPPGFVCWGDGPMGAVLAGSRHPPLTESGDETIGPYGAILYFRFYLTDVGTADLVGA